MGATIVVNIGGVRQGVSELLGRKVSVSINCRSFEVKFWLPQSSGTGTHMWGQYNLLVRGRSALATLIFTLRVCLLVRERSALATLIFTLRVCLSFCHSVCPQLRS